MAEGLNAGLLQQINDGYNKAAGGDDGPATDADSLFETILKQYGKMENRVINTITEALLGFGIKFGSLFNTGIFANLNTDGLNWTNKPMMQQGLLGSPTKSIIGDIAKQVFTDRLKFDKIQLPNIEGIPIQPGESVSLASLGNLSPDPTPISIDRSVGRDMFT